MNWDQWQAVWPHAAHSTFVSVRPHRWHVQQMGEGPDLVLLHGAGGATHSWRGLAPLLARGYRVTMMDLPGHGFTRLGTRRRSGLDAMAEDVATLLSHLGVAPTALIGHSAGAAIALRLSLDATEPLPVISINGAFQMFDGVAGIVFPLMAKALAANPLTARLFSAAGSEARTRRLLASTGSHVDGEGIRLYHALISDRDHVAGALAMMANWSLDRLVREAAGLEAPVLLLAARGDTTVPPRISEDMATRLPRVDLQIVDGLGHLMHEEAPDRMAGACLEFLSRVAEQA